MGDTGGQQADARQFFALLQRFLEFDAGRDVFEHDDRSGLLIRNRTERCDRDIQYQRTAGGIVGVQLVSVADLGQVPTRFAENIFEIECKAVIEDILDDRPTTSSRSSPIICSNVELHLMIRPSSSTASSPTLTALNDRFVKLFEQCELFGVLMLFLVKAAVLDRNGNVARNGA